MMSRKLELLMNTAVRKANEIKHEYLTLECILWAMMDDEKVLGIIKNLGADPEAIKKEIEEHLAKEDYFSVLEDDQIEEMAKTQFLDDELRRLAAESGIKYQPEITMSLQRVIQRAAMHVQSSGKKQIRGVNILVSLFGEKDNFATYVLQKHGIDRLKVVEYIAHGLDKAANTEDEAGSLDNIRGEFGASEDVQNPLEQFTVNLNVKASQGKIDPLIGRIQELERLSQVLCRRRKNNPLLVGEAGVGKTAIAEGLALAIVKESVPEQLKNMEIYSLDLAALLAGTKFRGEFEQRIKQVLKSLEKIEDDGRQAVLFIDEIHSIMGAGSTGGGSLDASNLLKPALNSGKIKCMGSTTHAEFRKFIEKDSAFSRRFQKIEVEEPSLSETVQILNGLKSQYEEHHKVEYSSEIVKTIAELANRFITDKHNPDKSLDVMDEVGSFKQLNRPKDQNITPILKEDVEKIVSFIAKVPQVSVLTNEKDKLKNLETDLKRLIFGQNDAVEKVADAIIMSRSGLGKTDRPIGNFLFCGPTGVGKTELARQLAINLGCELVRFDMSEYMEKHTVAKLIGAPPGYIGHESGGLLTDRIKKNPHSILLLDEIEKAHADIFNVLLQVMDHGKLTDSQGRSTDFRQTVVIMTTNAGAREMETGSIGLGGTVLAKNTSKRDQALKNTFSPEFRNRLDHIVYFNALSESEMVKIVEKSLFELEEKLLAKKVELEVTQEAKLWLAKEGYDPKLGARPIARIVDQRLRKELSMEVLFGKISDGGKVKVDLDDEKNLSIVYFT